MTEYAPRKGMTKAEIDHTVEAVLAEATLEEKVAMMSGQGFFAIYAQSGRLWGSHPYRAGGGVDRLGVPPLFFTDGPRGVARGNSTCFPCSMARGASFDVDLERRIGEVMGIEARAQGCTLSGAVCVNLLRHPAWGRAQETYGEDPFHVGEMGAGLAVGIQTHNVVATVKHFALNSMENARFKVDVRCDDRVMREVYLPHFKRIIDAGCASVMSAYNQWNGEYCGQNRALLTDILRHEWGFDGFVHSDWVFGLRKVHAAAAGLDVENPEPLVFGGKLVEAVQAGHVEPSVIDTACRRILTTTYRFAAAEDPLENYTPDLVACAKHRAIAREAALKSAVLLKNESVLPLARNAINRIAVLGKLAALENTGDNGSSRVRPPYVITPVQGLRQHLGDDRIVTGDEDDLIAAKQAAASSDAVIVVAGYTAAHEGEYIPEGGIDLGQGAPQVDALGESANPGKKKRPAIGGDRASLRLPPEQVALIDAAADSGKPVIVVIVAGSAVIVEEWIDRAGAAIQTFYAGMEGGAALAMLLFGDVSPSGRLPFSVAKREEDYPFFDRDADRIEYDLFHGYSHLEREGVAPRFAFGHGLSYGRFSYRALKARVCSDTIEIQVSVSNAGAMTADEVVLAFVAPPPSPVDRQRRLLKAFERVTIDSGAQTSVTLTIRIADLARYCQHTKRWIVDPGLYAISVGGREATVEL